MSVWFHILPEEENWTQHTSTLELSLREVLFQIIKFVNEKRDHIPSIPNLEGVSFPYEITTPRLVTVSTTLIFNFFKYKGNNDPSFIKFGKFEMGNSETTILDLIN